MAHLDQKEAFSEFKAQVLKGIAAHFPMEGRLRKLELERLEADDSAFHPDDIRSQHEARLTGKSWAVPVNATLVLRDTQTGDVLQRRTLKVAEIPHTTRRHGYILDGQEYQVDNQWQLKPGAYTRRRQSGELETRFNIPNNKSFDITFDPESRLFLMDRGKSKAIPVYPLMKVMGVDDGALEKQWGKDILAANQNARAVGTALQRFYKADLKTVAPSREEAEKHFLQTMAQSKLRPDSTAVTLGHPFETVNGDALLRATTKMIGVQQGRIPEDDRDSLVFKDLRSIGDFAHDKLTNWKATQAIKAKVARQFGESKGIRDLIKFDTFNEPVRDTFLRNAAANPGKQINPVEMMSSAMRTTIMGPGGIKSTQAVMDEAKLINPSHLGFLDPIHTPECMTPDAEVFTSKGWVRWDEVTWDTEFACRIDGRLEFHKAEHIHKGPYEGLLYGVRNGKLDYLVTPNHRVYTRPADPACTRWRIERADEVHGKPRTFCAFHSAYEGSNQSEFFQLTRVPGNNSSVHVDKVRMTDWCELVGWVLSEGTITFDEEKSAYFVRIAQSYSANLENCERIEALLRRLPWRWCQDAEKRSYAIGVKELAGQFRDQGYCDTKYIPPELFHVSVPARQALLEALLLGDGRVDSRRATGVSYKQRVFCTTSRQLALDFERLALGLGYSVRVKVYQDNREERYLDVYEVRILRHVERTAWPKKGHYYTKQYNGLVYCATVPGSLLLVRRNSSVPIWTGNSEKTGVSLHLPMGVKKMGRTPMIPAYNIQTGKMERVAPATFLSSNVVLPDQVTWKDNKPVPRSDVVKMAARGDNIVRQGKFNEAQYVMRHPSQMFSVTSNLVPFLGNNSGARATYATAHLEQAISLVNRDEPLVQVGTGSDKPGMRTFEEFLGRNTGHVSPVTGVVTKVSQDGIHIKGEDGKHREVQLYNNFPLNDPKAVFHSTPLVQVGDKVHEGQAVADTNYTKNGKLALGANLRVAYLPYKGYNFEDGVVISESAAKKLSSMHLHKPVMRLDKGVVSEPRKFNVQHPEAFTREQYKLLDERGIVKPGQVVKTGDPLVLGTRPYNLQDRTGAYAIRKNASGAHTDVSMRWESDYPGMVVGVHEGKKGEVAVHVRTIEPMQVGDKLTGRHGNKGIVTQVLPDHEMPKTKDGAHIDAALNPAGIPSRTNIGQVLETAASKIALKTGKPYVVENFLKSDDMLSHVENELKKHGLSDTEELIDPKTGISLGRALTGHQHMLKLTHQIDKKLSVRSGMSISGAHPESYDFNLMPASGGKTGGQSMGNLGLYALLAHGAKANIREMQTWKSEGEDPAPEHKQWKSQHKDVWAAIQNGDPLPVPKSTFAFQKFTDMLRASGINVEKQGNHFRLTPLTDKQVLGMSKGALPNPAMLTRADLDENGQPKPIAGGLFDPKITGGHDGKNWSHFKLAEPMPNPIFEGAIQKLIGMKGKDYTSLIHSERSIDKDTHSFVPLGTKNSITGGPAIAHMLSKLDVKAELAKAKSELAAAPMPKNLAFGADTGKVDRALKKIKYLSVLDELDLHPKDAYVIHNLPVIPPAMRPVSVLPGEKRVNIKWADLNGLYRDIAMLNKKMEHETFQKYLGDEDKREQRAGLYDGLKALMGVGANFAEREDKSKGLMLQIAGKQPKSGYFQKTLLNRRQDLTMRSTIVPEPSLGLDQVGLPTEKALSLFRPFVVKKMVDIGAAEHPLDAQKQLGVKGSYKNPNILKALDLAMEERPILLKRDPVLHKHGVQAFHAIRAPGRAIQIHPLVTGGYNADFDGDTMSAYVPISKEAVAEARKMFPSNNLYNESTGKITYAPTQESALGLYKLTLTGNQTTHKFGNPAELLNAAHKGELGINDVAHVGGVGHTTAGRVLVASALPEPMQQKVLTDHSFLLDKGNLPKMLMDVSKQHSEHFGATANRLKDLGYDASFGLVRIPNPGNIGEAAIKSAELGKDVKVIRMPTHTLSFVDFKADHGVRDAIVKSTQKKVDAINKMKIPQMQKDERAVELWSKATKQMLDEHHAKVKKDPTNLSVMLGTGGSKLATGYQQVKLGPMLLADTSGRVIPTPVARSYSEGLDLAGYWTQMHGARKGTVQKVQEVQEPGFFTKQLINTSMSLMVNGEDCGTTRGIGLPVTSKDVHDRILATDFNVKGRVFPRGTVLSPDIVSHIRTADKTAIVPVRSPLKCEHAKGLCQKCAGLAPNGKHYEPGTNVGILASQSVGEPSTQLALRLFHTGGIVESKKNVIGMFGRIQQLTSLPKKIPDAATLAMTSGNIQKIHHDKLGTTVTIGGQSHFVPLDRAGRRLTDAVPGLPKPSFVSWSPLKVGMKVNAGDPLSDPSRTFVNPHDLYKATNNMEVVQNHIVNELHSLYEDVGVRRPHFETLVKAMGNLTRVRDPGDAPNILKGEYQQASNVRAINRELVARGRKPVEHTPILQGINVLPLSVQEDWMAKLNFARLRGTLSEAAATGGRTDLHGVHPIPGMAFGAEFGMTSEHARTHPHLKNVPRHGY